MTGLPPRGFTDSLKSPPDAVHEHALLATSDLDFHARDSVVHDVAQVSRIGVPHPPREMPAVGPVLGVVVRWDLVQCCIDASPVHALYVIRTQLVQDLTGSKDKSTSIPRLRSARP